MIFYKLVIIATIAAAAFGDFHFVFAPTVHAQGIDIQVATSTATVVVPPIPDAVACNCWAYVKSLKPTLPNTASLKPNGTPAVGTVAILDYEGTMHYALITALGDAGFTVDESNYHHCEYDARTVEWNDPHLVGFYHFSA